MRRKKGVSNRGWETKGGDLCGAMCVEMGANESLACCMS